MNKGEHEKEIISEEYSLMQRDSLYSYEFIHI